MRVFDWASLQLHESWDPFWHLRPSSRSVVSQLILTDRCQLAVDDLYLILRSIPTGQTGSLSISISPRHSAQRRGRFWNTFSVESPGAAVLRGRGSRARITDERPTWQAPVEPPPVRAPVTQGETARRDGQRQASMDISAARQTSAELRRSVCRSAGQP
jgi:hypothetical protein